MSSLIADLHAKTGRELERMTDAVIMVVADVFIVDEDELTAKGQGPKYVVEARFAAYALMRAIIGMGDRRIGNFFKRGHDGIEYGRGICDAKRQSRPDYDENYKTCERLLKNML